MKNQVLFSSKDKRKRLKCPLLQFLFGTLRVNSYVSKTQTKCTFRQCSDKLLLSKLLVKCKYCIIYFFFNILL